MKKFVLLTVIALLAVGAVSAQGWPWASPPAPPVTVRVEGTLQLQNGHIVLSTGTAVYFVPGLMRYIGFIDGLREGATISAEGFASGNFLQPSKLTIGGREYDFAANTPGWGTVGGPAGWCPMGGPMRGHHMGSRGQRGRGRW